MALSRSASGVFLISLCLLLAAAVRLEDSAGRILEGMATISHVTPVKKKKKEREDKTCYYWAKVQVLFVRQNSLT